MLTISHAILHAFDFETGRCALSEHELDVSERTIRSYVQRHVRKASESPEARGGEFAEGSAFAERLVSYRSGGESFLDLSQELGQWFWEELRRADSLQQADLLVVEYEETPDAKDAQESADAAAALFEGAAERFFAVVLLPRRQVFVHDVGMGDNVIARTDAVLPAPTQKVSTYAVVSLASLAIVYQDQPRLMQGEERHLIRDGLLQCVGRASSREVIQQVSQVAAEVALSEGIDPSVAAARAKAVVVHEAEADERVEPAAVGRAVFEGRPEAIDRYEREVAEREMPEGVSVRRGVANRLAKSHRIRTDTGVEITFPSELIEREGYIEFVDAPDGHVSIVIGNVGRIENR